jgi:phosphoesterase RecJ-like protein
MYQGIRKILNFIRSADNFLVTSHMNADGDAFASMLAMAYLLENWKKRYRIIINDEIIDDKYQYMWGIEKIEKYSSDITDDFQAAIVLDVPSKKRVGNPSLLLPEPKQCVKIDHHPVEEDFAIYSIVDTEASSTSQILYEIINQAKLTISPELASLIFSGIMYDTGRFSFSNTRFRDFEISAVLVKKGAIPNDIANYLFFNNSFLSMKILGYALANMESLYEGKLSVIFLPLDIMKNNIHAEIEELANYSVAIKSVEVGLFIREVEPGYFKMSFRSKGNVNVNQIAKLFGGGGHIHAAGARYSGNFKDLREKIKKAVKKQLLF